MTGIDSFGSWYKYEVFLVVVINLAGPNSSTSGIMNGVSDALHVYFSCKVYALPVPQTI